MMLDVNSEIGTSFLVHLSLKIYMDVNCDI